MTRRYEIRKQGKSLGFYSKRDSREALNTLAVSLGYKSFQVLFADPNIEIVCA